MLVIFLLGFLEYCKPLFLGWPTDYYQFLILFIKILLIQFYLFQIHACIGQAVHPCPMPMNVLECLHTFVTVIANTTDVSCHCSFNWPKIRGRGSPFFKISRLLLVRFWQTRAHFKAKEVLLLEFAKIKCSRIRTTGDHSETWHEKVPTLYILIKWVH